MNWRSYGDVSYERWAAEVDRLDGPAELATREAWQAASPHSALLLAMMFVESKYGTAFNRNVPGNKNALNLRPPIRADGTREPGDYMRFGTWTAGVWNAARRITSQTYGGGIYSRTRTLRDLVNVYAPSGDDNDPDAYARTVERLLTEWGIEGDTPMPIVAKECPLEIAVLTGNQPNRPALPMESPSFVTVHEVGNTKPGADEDMHRDFVHNGGGESSVSFQLVVGPTKAIQLIYLNENAWHASDGFSGRGNRDSIAIETIQIGDFDRTLAHLAWLIAELYRNPRRFALNPAYGFADDLAPHLYAERTKQHNFWAPDNKNCPQFIRDRNLWPSLLAAVGAELEGDDAPTYAEPRLPSWWSEDALNSGEDHGDWKYLHRDYVVVKPTRALATANWRAKDNETRADLEPGEVVDGRYLVRSSADKALYVVSKYGSRIRAAHLSPVVTLPRDRAA